VDFAALASVAALLVAIVLSCATRLNIGLVAIPLAWLVGALAGLDPAKVMSGFPVNLFLTLSGVTVLFTQAELNATLAAVTHSILRLAHGNAGWVLVLFFLLAAILSSLGAGALAATALVMPIAMRTAERAQVSLFLMAVLVCMGANAGNLSPVSPVGVIASTILEREQLPGHLWRLYWNNLWSHAVLSAVAFLCFGGLAAFRQTAALSSLETPQWTWRNYLTLAAIAALLLATVFWKVPLGLAAFTAALLLIFTRAAAEAAAVAKMPWGVILMVSGVTLLISQVERAGGMDLFAGWIARVSGPQTVHAILAFVTAAVSTYSSTSGVVMPAFLPTIPKLAASTGADPISLVSSLILGSHLVDVSPLSTIGAMAVAAVTDSAQRDRLFNRLLIWSFSMCLVGAASSTVFFLWLGR
jgi:di/tricarboxylate transporter